MTTRADLIARIALNANDDSAWVALARLHERERGEKHGPESWEYRWALPKTPGGWWWGPSPSVASTLILGVAGEFLLASHINPSPLNLSDTASANRRACVAHCVPSE